MFNRKKTQGADTPALPAPAERDQLPVLAPTGAPLALVTGGSRGIGRSIALALARAGSDVILTYHRNIAAANATVAQIENLHRRALALPLDIGRTAEFDGFVAQLRDALAQLWQRERFDHLVNNAGTGTNAAFVETSEEQFDAMLNVQLKGMFFLTQKLLPVMRDGGRIVNISSGLTRFALPGFSAYAATKGAVEVLTRYLAKELGARRIAVNVVAPGPIATDFGGGTVRDEPKLNAFLAAQAAFGRVGQPEDVGSVVATLLSPAMGWVTAQRIEASGGMFI